jgi:hypothetical protein
LAVDRKKNENFPNMMLCRPFLWFNYFCARAAAAAAAEIQTICQPVGVTQSTVYFESDTD